MRNRLSLENEQVTRDFLTGVFAETAMFLGTYGEQFGVSCRPLVHMLGAMTDEDINRDWYNAKVKAIRDQWVFDSEGCAGDVVDAIETACADYVNKMALNDVDWIASDVESTIYKVGRVTRFRLTASDRRKVAELHAQDEVLHNYVRRLLQVLDLCVEDEQEED